MIRNTTVILALVVNAFALNAHAVERQRPPGIGEFQGVHFGVGASSVHRLVPAFWPPPGCAREQLYRRSDLSQPHVLADVRLDWPGVPYRFFDDRFCAAEATYQDTAGSFEKLQGFLVSRYGNPMVSQSWQSAPPQSFVYRQRLHSLGWYSADGHRELWLTGNDDEDSVTVIDNPLSGERAAAIGASLPRRTARSGSRVTDASVRELVKE